MTRGELLRPILIIFPRTLRTAATDHASHAVAMLFQYRRHGLVMRRPPKNPAAVNSPKRSGPISVMYAIYAANNAAPRSVSMAVILSLAILPRMARTSGT
jgi:hypothetical protein